MTDLLQFRLLKNMDLQETFEIQYSPLFTKYHRLLIKLSLGKSRLQRQRTPLIEYYFAITLVKTSTESIASVGFSERYLQRY